MVIISLKRSKDYWKKIKRQVKFNDIGVGGSRYKVSLKPPSPSLFRSQKTLRNNFQFSQYFRKIFKYRRGKTTWSSGKCIGLEDQTKSDILIYL